MKIFKILQELYVAENLILLSQSKFGMISIEYN